MLKVREIIDKIEELAPPEIAEKWDNVGLQVGSLSSEVQAILVTLDVTEEVIQKAIELGVNLIISHHPLIFSPLTRVTEETPAGRMISLLINNGISVYTAHTNLDLASGGLNNWLSSRLGLMNVKPLQVKGFQKLYKLVVFVPVEHLNEVKEAIFEAGGGSLGNYSKVSFYSRGTGTFQPQEGSAPFIGKEGVEEKVDEYRLEVLVPQKRLTEVISALLKAHPYEEVAYDLISLENRGSSWGLGTIGELPSSMDFYSFADLVCERLAVRNVRFVPVNERVKRIAICSGSGGSLLHDAKRKGADILLTGEIKYHQALEAKQSGLGILEIGHYDSEKIMIEELGAFILNCLKNTDVQVHLCKLNTDPFKSR